jgi:Est1 DNA/RNA binding domain
LGDTDPKIISYSMMALLYETVPAFEDTWIECLGDLGRYRMAIEDDDIRDREVWTGVARHWYSKASDKAPTTGRLYHHLAILARPNALQQLFYYAKSLCVVIPFNSARESILTLFDPVLTSDNHQSQYRLPPLDNAFVKAHGLLFTNKNMEKFEPTMKEFLGLLDNQIGRVTRKFMEQGFHIAVANCVALLGFASKDSVLMKAIESSDATMAGSPSDHTPQSLSSFKNSQQLANDTLKIVLERIGDPNVLPFIYVTLVFMQYMARHPGGMSYLQAEFPWDPLARMLNTLLGSHGSTNRIEDERFPKAEKDDVRPFPEDFAIRGLLWTEGYFPDGYFSNEKIDEEEKYHELPSMTAERKGRILWLGRRISNRAYGLDFDGKHFLASKAGLPIEALGSSLTYAAATTVENIASEAKENVTTGSVATSSPRD